MKTLPTQYTLPYGRVIDIPAGLKCKPATNLPEESVIQFWLVELTPEMQADPEIDSHHRNYGFGLTAEQVMRGPKWIKYPERNEDGDYYGDFLCRCGEVIEVFGCGRDFDCEECHAEYNSAGQLLAPRSQWGEETGECAADYDFGYNNPERAFEE